MKNLISRGISKALGRGRTQPLEKPEAIPPGTKSIQMPREQSKILSRCLSIDLEVDPKEAKLFAFAAVPEGDGEGIVHRKGDLKAALEKLDLFCAGFAHVIGHNILRHDLPHLMGGSGNACVCCLAKMLAS